jgi:hypothetical protein
MQYQLLTNSKQLSFPREATGCSATQYIIDMLWNARVHYHVQSQTLAPILNQMNSAHTIFFKRSSTESVATASACLHKFFEDQSNF